MRKEKLGKLLWNTSALHADSFRMIPALSSGKWSVQKCTFACDYTFRFVKCLALGFVKLELHRISKSTFRVDLHKSCTPHYRHATCREPTPRSLLTPFSTLGYHITSHLPTLDSLGDPTRQIRSTSVVDVLEYRYATAPTKHLE